MVLLVALAGPGWGAVRGFGGFGVRVGRAGTGEQCRKSVDGCGVAEAGWHAGGPSQYQSDTVSLRVLPAQAEVFPRVIATSRESNRLPRAGGGVPVNGVERFNRTLQTEWAYHQVFTSNNERAAVLVLWLHTYNHHRRHHALGGHPPISRCHQPHG